LRRQRRSAVATLVAPPNQIIGQRPQPLRERVGGAMRLDTIALADNGAHRIDALIDETERNLRKIRSLLDQAAQTFGNVRGCREAESCGVSLYVVRGAEQTLACYIGETFRVDPLARAVELLALVAHPPLELCGEFFQRFLGGRNRIAIRGASNHDPDCFLEPIRYHDDLVIAEFRDARRQVPLLSHGVSLSC
jgi:hypothetical protein